MDPIVVATHELLFGVRRSVRYHRRRGRFFDRWGKVTNFLNVVFGSAAVASVIGEGHAPKWIGILAAIVVTVVSTVDLVVGTGTVARDHFDLARRFIDLEREITLIAAPTEAQLREFEAKRLTIEGDEPHVMRMLDLLCQNELLLAMGYDDEKLAHVGWFKRRLAQLVDFDTENVKNKRPRKPALPASSDRTLLS